MIRINLLAAERDRARPRPGLLTGQKVTIASSLILVLATLSIGWMFWDLHQQSVRLDEEIVAARQEVSRLESVLQQVQLFEARKALLQQRVALIEQLRRGQGGPVQMLDQISRSLPDRLWLSELTQQGADITLGGRTTSLSALSDLIANLESSGYFRRPVEIVSSQVESGQQGDLVRFSIKAQFAPPGS